MNEKRKSWGWLMGAMLVSCLAAVSAQEATTDETTAVGEATVEPVDPGVEEAVAAAEGFPPEQIEQLLAPIALYPDALLAQVLMASTYPLDIVQASRWIKDHGDLEGEALEQAAAEEPWDPSVQALVFFPDLLARMNDNLDWTQDLGEAYLGQEDEVLDAIQQLRLEAHEAGNLESNEHQQVVVELWTSNGPAHHASVVDLRGPTTDHPDAEPGDGLQGVPGAVGLQVQVHGRRRFGCDPARAGLVAGEAGAVDYEHVDPGRDQACSAGGPGWSAADDQDLTPLH